MYFRVDPSAPLPDGSQPGGGHRFGFQVAAGLGELPQHHRGLGGIPFTLRCRRERDQRGDCDSDHPGPRRTISGWGRTKPGKSAIVDNPTGVATYL